MHQWIGASLRDAGKGWGRTPHMPEAKSNVRWKIRMEKYTRKTVWKCWCGIILISGIVLLKQRECSKYLMNGRMWNYIPVTPPSIHLSVKGLISPNLKRNCVFWLLCARCSQSTTILSLAAGLKSLNWSVFPFLQQSCLNQMREGFHIYHSYLSLVEQSLPKFAGRVSHLQKDISDLSFNIQQQVRSSLRRAGGGVKVRSPPPAM